ncbi:hypothetical protein [Burkholderia pyrrocinia]|uniref:hypothetical protein n=1 Tax=Burkholderia pyrrocinia TaxID=60550 RepID=UPI001BCCCA7A|nr:hypothetical protein [Burkholderia pyrrocinia]QVN21769.1 hypothetical protein JYG32_20515 [Burkholderia pyrrocinia]
MADQNPTSIDTADVLAVDASVIRTTSAAPYGVTPQGFYAKPFARLLAEKLALGRALFGTDLDLTSGSVVRKLFEVAALEDARTWTALGAIYDNMFVVSAEGQALSGLGAELGLPRPYLEATGKITLKLTGTLPAGVAQIAIPRGARLLTPGGHHVATDESATITAASPQADIAVVAFYPGPSHNLDPAVTAPDGSHPEQIDRWNPYDTKLADLRAAEEAANKTLMTITHSGKLAGGELQWPDARYRSMLLRAPRSIWTVDAIQIAVSLVPGVRQALIRDAWGGLDINQSIFGNFNFVERVFGSERDLGNPYYFTVLVSPTDSAIWDGPDGLEASVLSAIEDLRPLGIFPQVQQAEQIGICVNADLVVRGIPMPFGSKASVNASAPAQALKARLNERLRRYVDSLSFGEPVRVSEVIWAMMSEPGITDVQNVQLLRYPPAMDNIDFTQPPPGGPAGPGCGLNIDLAINQVADFVDTATELTII